ncbi:MAG: acetolactate synthase small subunit [Thermodesulfobacteriota bacterium]
MNTRHNEKHVLSLLVQNEPGVLSRISGLFSGRGFNIESLAVAETAEGGISRITLMTKGDQAIVEQIKKQLNKIINVIKVIDFEDTPCVHRELGLVKVRARPGHRAEIHRLVGIFRCRVVDVGRESCTIEITGDDLKVEAFLDLLRPFGIKEIARTGVIALAREGMRERGER